MWLLRSSRVNLIYDKFRDKLSQFLSMNGRMKFINPVYRILAEKQPELGLRIFNMCRNSYHSIAVA